MSATDIQNYVNQNPDLVQQLINQTTKKEINAVAPPTSTTVKNDGVLNLQYLIIKAEKLNVSM